MTDRDQPDRQRDLASPDDAREDVATETIGAHQVLQRRRLQRQPLVGLDRVVRSDQRRGQRDQHDQHQHVPPTSALRLRSSRAATVRRPRGTLDAAVGASRNRDAVEAQASAGALIGSGSVDRASRTRRRPTRLTSTYAVAANSTVPCTSGKSRLRMASTASRPMPGPRKDRLGDDRAAEQRAKLQAEHRDRRDERVLERVTHHDELSARDPWRAR